MLITVLYLECVAEVFIQFKPSHFIMSKPQTSVSLIGILFDGEEELIKAKMFANKILIDWFYSTVLEIWYNFAPYI